MTKVAKGKTKQPRTVPAPAPAVDSDLVRMTVRYTPGMLTEINRFAHKVGLDRGNMMRAAIAERLDWRPEVPPVVDSRAMIPITLRMPREMYARFLREAKARGLDKSSLARMWTLEKVDWRAKK